jgi:predicted DNA-binding transcriptional regulator AlpA
MELKNNITPSVLAAATSLLQPYAPDLSPSALVRAIKAYKSETTTEANTISRPMTRKQVSELLGCSLQSVNRYMNEGKIQRIILSPRSVRIDRQSVQDFLAGTESREVNHG